eukprot:1157909-Pelagomonas_calceolata.AAC.15
MVLANLRNRSWSYQRRVQGMQGPIPGSHPCHKHPMRRSYVISILRGEAQPTAEVGILSAVILRLNTCMQHSSQKQRAFSQHAALHACIAV